MTKVKAILEPTVRLVSRPDLSLLAGVLEDFYGDALQERDLEPGPAELIEFAGRTCYEATKRGRPETSTARGYIANIMDQRHYSVLEHAHFSLFIKGISRALSHELVRHRHFSFSQESQRYVLATKSPSVVIPPAIIEASLKVAEENGFDEVPQHVWDDTAFDLFGGDYAAYEENYEELRKSGLDRKQASEASRAFIPNAAETKIVVSGNVRSWMEFIEKRDADGADAEIRRLAKVIAKILAEELPEVFDDEARKLWSGASEQKGVQNG